VAAYPSSDESFFLLHAAGWSVGDVLLWTEAGSLWVVSGTNGENRIVTRAAGQAEAWYRAVEQALSLGMLRRGYHKGSEGSAS
jgi:hypothetical protein